MNEKNLPFVDLEIANSNYNNRILPFLGNVDSGTLFKWYLYNILRILGIALLIGGIALSIMELFGDDGFIKQTFGNDAMEGGKKAGAGAGLVVGFVLSIVTAWAMYSIVKKRSEQLNDQAYTGLLHFLYATMAPRMITLVGELAFCIVLYVGILSLMATLVGSMVYAPLLSFSEILLSLPGVDMVGGMIPNSISGDYDTFTQGMKVSLITIFASVAVLIAYYIYREIYNYAVLIVTNLIKFLPKFAIPIAVRNKSEQ